MLHDARYTTMDRPGGGEVRQIAGFSFLRSGASCQRPKDPFPFAGHPRQTWTRTIMRTRAREARGVRLI